MITRGFGTSNTILTRGFGGYNPVVEGIKKHIIAFLFVVTSVRISVTA
jgi:hypothetical protein